MIALRTATIDLIASLKSWRLWSLLGWIEIRQRYARSKLGPFWLTISMGVLIATLGIVYGGLFGVNMSTYLPMLSIGFVAWGLFSGIVNEGCSAYISSSNYIRQVQTSRLIYVLQVAWRNLIVFAHNAVIVVIVLGIYGVPRWTTVPLFVPGLALLLLNAVWIAIVVGLLSARYRDIPQIVSAMLQVLFYITPILFHGSMLKTHTWIVEYNPLAYLIDLVRQPLTGRMPSPGTWAVGICMAITGWVFALILTGRYHKRIPYWV